MILWDGTFPPCLDQMNVICVTHVDQALAVLAKWPARGPEPIVIAFAAAEMSLDIAKQIDRLAGTGTACVLSPPELSPEQTLVWLENEIGGVALHLEPTVDDLHAMARLTVTIDANVPEEAIESLREIVTKHGGTIRREEVTIDPTPFWESVRELAGLRDQIPEERRAMSGRALAQLLSGESDLD